MAKPPIEHLVSAGGVVLREVDGKLEVLLCGRPSVGLWGLPKGTPDEGESLQDTALREVEEETGIKPRIVEKVGSIQYWFTRTQDKTRCHKTVHYYLMLPVSGSTSLHDMEYDEVGWFPVEAAHAKLTFDNDTQMVGRAVEIAEQRKLSDKTLERDS